MRLTGFEAIEFAEKAGLTLNKAADNIDPSAAGLSIAEAGAIADDRPELIWVDVEDGEYYGEHVNMEPGGLPGPNRRLAGQRRDELLPGQNSGHQSRDSYAAGTPAGGSAAGGLGGTNAGDGSPENAELEDGLGSGKHDHSGDRLDEKEPQSGRLGGAIGGTPAGKRSPQR